MDWTGLDELIEILERHRKENKFATIIVQIRDHTYDHVKKTVTESTPIKKQKPKNSPTKEIHGSSRIR